MPVVSVSQKTYEIIRLLRPLYKFLEKAVSDLLVAKGLNVSERAVLEMLYFEKLQPVPHLAKSLVVERQFIQRIVNDLMEQELVEKRENPAHKRSSLIALTPAGQCLITDILASEKKVLDQVMQDIRFEDVAICHEVMTHLTLAFAQISQNGGKR